MGLRRFLLMISIVMVILLITAVWFFPSNEDFRVENPFWNGTGDINDSHAVQPLEKLSDLPSTPQGVTLILVPYLKFTPAELEQLIRFVSDGGRLILADDYGYGNQVLESLGLETRFSGEILLDPMVNYRNKYFPGIVHFEPDPLTGDVENLLFNHATCLTDVNTADILALSSSFSFLDRNGNGTREDNEPTGPLPVITRHESGGGQVILIADPSLFINSMEPLEGNSSFIRNITATTTVLYIDQSHLPPSELHQSKNLLAQIRRPLVTYPGAAGLVTLALALVLIPVWHKKQESQKDSFFFQILHRCHNAIIRQERRKL